MIAVARAFAYLALMIASRGRRLERMHMESTHKQLRGAWRRRNEKKPNGPIAYACELPRTPLGPPLFEPCVMHAKDDDRDAVRTMRNVRRRDRKRGRSPSKWM